MCCTERRKRIREKESRETGVKEINKRFPGVHEENREIRDEGKDLKHIKKKKRNASIQSEGIDR